MKLGQGFVFANRSSIIVSLFKNNKHDIHTEAIENITHTDIITSLKKIDNNNIASLSNTANSILIWSLITKQLVLSVKNPEAEPLKGFGYFCDSLIGFTNSSIILWTGDSNKDLVYQDKLTDDVRKNRNIKMVVLWEKEKLFVGFDNILEIVNLNIYSNWNI